MMTLGWMYLILAALCLAIAYSQFSVGSSSSGDLGIAFLAGAAVLLCGLSGAVLYFPALSGATDVGYWMIVLGPAWLIPFSLSLVREYVDLGSTLDRLFGRMAMALPAGIILVLVGVGVNALSLMRTSATVS